MAKARAEGSSEVGAGGVKTKRMLEYLDAWDAGQAGVVMPTLGETLSALREIRSLLESARSLIDTLNANAQGQTSADVRDPITNAVCNDMIARIDDALPVSQKRDATTEKG